LVCGGRETHWLRGGEARTLEGVGCGIGWAIAAAGAIKDAEG